MTFWTLSVVVALAAFALTSAVASIAVALVWSAARASLDRLGPATRAGLLLALRLLPALASTVVAGVFVWPAFHRFEPRGHDETVGISLALLAGVGAVLVGVALRRVWRMARDTRRFARSCAAGRKPLAMEGGLVPASIVDSGFPLVAVVGLLRPRLLVARRVLSACTPRELRAILAHESCHVRALDNLKRLAMRGCPDVLSLTEVGASLERAWRQAAEEAADDHAARVVDGGAIDLALALLKVARMTVAGQVHSLPVIAFHHGDSLERRVRRLLRASPPETATPAWWRAARGLGLGAGILVVAAGLDARLLAGVQAAVELAVTHLP